ncbi:hypothetical protein GCM10010389_49610 [Streptomyces echinoruber]|uniref:Uncharacterized protein n=1 Tax=Streptomyces echinoruber TaxID=68898 RepID=A0A918VKS4_9ACTN|nr:hypothetical protein GCM10010389_49610 [Streptomyces echinoruber]
MYHRLKDKPDLAPAAIRRTAEELRAAAERGLGGPGPHQRIDACLRCERDVLREGEFPPELDGEAVVTAVLATVQGGHVPARASGSPSAFDAGVRGRLSLLAPRPPGRITTEELAMHLMHYESAPDARTPLHIAW